MLYGGNCLLTGEFNAEDVFDVFQFVFYISAYWNKNTNYNGDY